MDKLIQVADLAPGHYRGGVFHPDGIFPTLIATYDSKANYSFIVLYEEITDY